MTEATYELGDPAVVVDVSSMTKADRAVVAAGTKVFVTGPRLDSDGRIEVSRPGQTPSGVVTVLVRPDGLTRDLTRRSPADEAAVSRLIEGIVGLTGSNISRTGALELLDALDDARASVTS